MKHMTVEEARRLVAIGIKRGWIKPPKPQEPVTEADKPKEEK
jgi:hypothetical protein